MKYSWKYVSGMDNRRIVRAQQALFAKRRPFEERKCRCPLTHLPTSDTPVGSVVTGNLIPGGGHMCVGIPDETEILRYYIDAQSHRRTHGQIVFSRKRAFVITATVGHK